MSPPPAALQARLVRAFVRGGWAAFALASAVLWACAVPPPERGGGSPLAAIESAFEPAIAGAFRARQFPAADGLTLTALERPARAAPARYRVIVIPGSGCAGMAPLAPRYFAGLLHAQVLVLHKPGVDPYSRSAPGDCSGEFVRTDALSTWRDHARAALRAAAAQRAGGSLAQLPQLLIGISEGAELLPALAPEVAALAGMVLIGASGLDPLEAGTLQAQRLGAAAVAQWQALGAAQAAQVVRADAWPASAADSAVQQGRSLRYWRDLWHWPLQQALLTGPWPLLQVWGERDALVPASAYARFTLRAQGRLAAYCPRRLAGADHGLQRAAALGEQAAHDGVQQVWGWLENWGRAPQQGLCAGLAP